MKELLVYGEKTFKIEVPDDAKITFGPWSPPTSKETYHNEGGKRGTLRIYRGTKENCVAVFAGVTGYRDLSLKYSEQVAREEGATIWRSDEDGYTRDENVARRTQWVQDPVKRVTAPRAKPAARKSTARRRSS